MPSRKLPDYADVADATIKSKRCRGIRPNGQTCHENHDGTLANGEVHWSDRRPTRGGIRRFLHLAAMLQINIVSGPTTPHWLKYLRAQRLVQIWAEQLGIRFPASITDQYRAELRAMVAPLPTSTPGREEAMQWSTIRAG